MCITRVVFGNLQHSGIIPVKQQPHLSRAEIKIIAAFQRLEGGFREEIAELPRKEVVWRHPYQKPAPKAAAD